MLLPVRSGKRPTRTTALLSRLLALASCVLNSLILPANGMHPYCTKLPLSVVFQCKKALTSMLRIRTSAVNSTGEAYVPLQHFNTATLKS